MVIDLLCDGHVHTHLCMHASGTMEAYVQSAINKGLEQIIFLEHLEEGIDYAERTWLRDEDFDYYFKEGERLKNKYREHIAIGLGVEVGYNPYCPEKIIARLNRRKWDRVGISYHFYRHRKNTPHLNLLSRKQKNIDSLISCGISQILNHYFKTLIEAVQVIQADVLCHLDAGLRYVPHLNLNEAFHEQIDQLLLQVKRSNMALELNSSGYPIRNSPFPSFGVIDKACELTIPLVAGSDAHTPSQVGRYFKQLEADLTRNIST